MSCEYSFPDASALQGEPNRAVLGSLEYECSTCTCKMTSALTLKSHVDGKAHKKKMAAASLEESPTVVEQIEEFSGLEAPHRAVPDEKKTAATQKWREEREQRKAEHDAMTDAEKEAAKAERKEQQAERKRQQKEDGIVPAAKKAKKAAPQQSYKCATCQVDLTGQAPFLAHMQSNKHLKKVAEFMGGCWLCGIRELNDDSHFNGGKHTKALARVDALGGDSSQMNATGWIQLKGGKKGQSAQQKKAKAKGKPNAGQQTPKAPKGDPDDPTCWEFVKGKCKRGDKCKWQH